MLADLMDDGVDGPAKKAERTTCPCGSGLEYDACCGALHAAGWVMMNILFPGISLGDNVIAAAS